MELPHNTYTEATMKPYTHFTLEERECLRIKVSEGKSLRKIAWELGRNVSTISRELKRNGKKMVATTHTGAGQCIAIGENDVCALCV